MEANEEIESSELEIVSLDHLPEYVVGLPMYLTVTLHAPPDTSFFRLEFGDPWNLRASMGVEATGKGKTIRSAPTPIIDETIGRPGQSLEGGETRRMMVDVSPLFFNVQPGKYSAQFFYSAPEVGAQAQPASINFRAPSTDEEALVARLAPNRKDFPTWTAWLTACRGPAITRNDLAQAGALSVILALRYLTCGSEPLAGIDPEAINILQGIYAPERDALKAELYAARGEMARSTPLQQKLRAQTAGLDWWMNLVDEGGGVLNAVSRRPIGKR